jgi:hypothetical protein
MTSGWFKAFSDFAKSGQKALDRYAQLHQMDEENQLKRKQLQMQEEQFKQQGEGFRTQQETARLQQESSRLEQQRIQAALFRDEGADLKSNLVQGGLLSPEQDAIRARHPEMGQQFEVTPPTAFQTQSNAVANSGASFRPMAPVPPQASSLQRAIMPAEAFQPTGVSVAPVAPQEQSTAKAGGFTADMFTNPQANPLQTLTTPGSTKFLGTPQQIFAQAEKAKKDAEIDQYATMLTSPDIDTQTRGRIGLAQNQINISEYTPYQQRQLAIAKGLELYQDKFAQESKHNPAVNRTALTPQEVLDTTAAYNAKVKAATGEGITAKEALKWGSIEIETGRKPLFSRGPADQASRAAYNHAWAEIFDKVPDAQSLQAEFAGLKSAERQTIQAQARIGAFHTTAKLNTGIVLDALDQAVKNGSLADTDNLTVNNVVNWLSRQSGNKDVAGYAAALQGMLSETAMVVRNPNLTGVLNDRARRELEDLLPMGFDMPQSLETIRRLLQESANREVGFDTTLQSIKDRQEALHNYLYTHLGIGGNTAGDGAVSGVTIPHNTGDAGDSIVRGPDGKLMLKPKSLPTPGGGGS